MGGWRKVRWPPILCFRYGIPVSKHIGKAFAGLLKPGEAGRASTNEAARFKAKIRQSGTKKHDPTRLLNYWPQRVEQHNFLVERGQVSGGIEDGRQKKPGGGGGH